MNHSMKYAFALQMSDHLETTVFNTQHLKSRCSSAFSMGQKVKIFDSGGNKKYNVKEGTGLGTCEGLVLGAFSPSCVHTCPLCSEAFWKKCMRSRT